METARDTTSGLKMSSTDRRRMPWWYKRAGTHVSHSSHVEAPAGMCAARRRPAERGRSRSRSSPAGNPRPPAPRHPPPAASTERLHCQHPALQDSKTRMLSRPGQGTRRFCPCRHAGCCMQRACWMIRCSGRAVTHEEVGDGAGAQQVAWAEVAAAHCVVRNHL